MTHATGIAHAASSSAPIAPLHRAAKRRRARLRGHRQCAASQWVFCLSALGLAPSCQLGHDATELLGATSPSPTELAVSQAARPALPPQYDSPEGYTLFEADPVRPIAVLDNSDLVAVANTVDDYIELFHRSHTGLAHCGQVKVGMRPVAVAAVQDSRRRAELWVSNHLSDSVSVIRVQPSSCAAEVIDTLPVADEPRDIVVGRDRNWNPRVFVATTHRGQNHHNPRARSGADLVTPPSEKQAKGMADLLVFDPTDRSAPPQVVNLFTDRVRALSVGHNTVYAAGFHTGNGTATIPHEHAIERGLARLNQLLERDESGALLEDNGQLVLSAAPNTPAMAGGMPAVLGAGRCLPDPRPGVQDRDQQQLCVQTDANHRALSIVEQLDGQVDERCHCGNADGTQQPSASFVVRFFSSPEQCGEALTTFPNGVQGCWLDGKPGGAQTPASHPGLQTPPMSWNDSMRFTLPDQDVFAVDTEDLSVKAAYSGVGTVVYSLATHPQTDKLFVGNTEAENLTRFEGHGDSSSTTVRGHLHESRITVIDPSDGRVSPVHLNDHIDYSQCCARVGDENANSFAFPTSGAFSDDGQWFFFTAMGSNTVGMVQSTTLSQGDFGNKRSREQGKLRQVSFGDDLENPAGPVGLGWDKKYQRLYVKTHFSNEVAVLEPRSGTLTQRIALPNPEPSSVREGRHVLYNARLTSSHGDSACGSCHVFGDLDSLGWDLGDPSGATVNNPGPFSLSPDIANTLGLASDPLARNAANRTQEADFRSNKGAMTTQTLRGMANHGPMHWRGDRTRRFSNEAGEQPNFGSFDEFNSFGEFDVAIEGLNGNDRPLSGELFDAFTEFALQLTLPPNPVRALDDSLTPAQQRARSLYFGCASMTDEQYAARQCIDLRGQLVNIEQATRDCDCASNPFVDLLEPLPTLLPFTAQLGQVLADSPLVEAGLEEAFLQSGLPPAAEDTFRAAAGALQALGQQVVEADLSLEPPGLLSQQSAELTALTAGTALGLVSFLNAGSPTGAQVFLDSLAAAFADADPQTPFDSVPTVFGALSQLFATSNINAHTQRDFAAEATGEFRNVLDGCSLSERPQCDLRLSDTLRTCHGCHTLDPNGNEEFGVERPGFFGTNGEYSFESAMQVLKVPHLRNLYQKTGAFGMVEVDLVNPLGNVGVLEDQTRFAGDQVRGFGFTHDGIFDSMQRFFASEVFTARADNGGGLERALPPAEDQPACMATFRQTAPEQLESVEPTVRAQLGLCLANSGVPDLCFLQPDDPQCTAALQALDTQTASDSSLVTTFNATIRPQCFVLGFDVDGRSEQSPCYSQGARETDDMTEFMMAFDSNLKPMVGQQVTVRRGQPLPNRAVALFASAAQGHCDLAARTPAGGWLVTEANAESATQSLLENPRGATRTWEQLSTRHRRITLTCYPPHPNQAEARRSAFDRPGRPLNSRR